MVLAVALVVLRGHGHTSPRAVVGARSAAPAARPAVLSKGTDASPFTVRGARARAMRIPILMYHVVSAPPPGTPEPELWVAQGTFRDEMQALARHGYVGISLQEAAAGWKGRGPLPPHPVVVSFDDGYLSDYTHAAPVLAALGWPGVLNLVLHNIGPGGLTPHEIGRLVRQGWELDSHTIDHPDLTTLGPQELRRQLVVSRRELRRRFGVPVDFFCYPSGRENATVVAAVAAAGYTGATTTAEGFADRSQGFLLRRIRVNGSDTAGTLLRRLAADARRG